MRGNSLVIRQPILRLMVYRSERLFFNFVPYIWHRNHSAQYKRQVLIELKSKRLNKKVQYFYVEQLNFIVIKVILII